MGEFWALGLVDGRQRVGLAAWEPGLEAVGRGVAIGQKGVGRAKEGERCISMYRGAKGGAGTRNRGIELPRTWVPLRCMHTVRTFLQLLRGGFSVSTSCKSEAFWCLCLLAADAFLFAA
jgi:hypothetical protein